MKIKGLSKSNTRAFLYIAIASFTALLADLSGFKTFGEISSVGLLVIVINFLLQGLIAWRAFLDQTISNVKKEEKESGERLYRTPRVVELNLEDDK